MINDDQTRPVLEGLVENVRVLSERVTALTATVESRLHDTRPLWEAVDNRLGAVETRLGVVETRLEAVETRLETVETRLGTVETRLGSIDAQLSGLRTDIRRVDHKIGLQNRTIGDLYADQRELEERITRNK